MKSYYLVCTIGFAWVLEAKDKKEVEKRKKRLRDMGYKQFWVYKRTYED